MKMKPPHKKSQMSNKKCLLLDLMIFMKNACLSRGPTSLYTVEFENGVLGEKYDKIITSFVVFQYHLRRMLQTSILHTTPFARAPPRNSI